MRASRRLAVSSAALGRTGSCSGPRACNAEAVACALIVMRQWTVERERERERERSAGFVPLRALIECILDARLEINFLPKSGVARVHLRVHVGLSRECRCGSCNRSAAKGGAAGNDARAHSFLDFLSAAGTLCFSLLLAPSPFSSFYVVRLWRLCHSERRGPPFFDSQHSSKSPDIRSSRFSEPIGCGVCIIYYLRRWLLIAGIRWISESSKRARVDFFF